MQSPFLPCEGESKQYNNCLFQSQPRCKAPFYEIRSSAFLCCYCVSISAEMQSPFLRSVYASSQNWGLSFNLSRDAKPLFTHVYFFPISRTSRSFNLSRDAKPLFTPKASWLVEWNERFNLSRDAKPLFTKLNNAVMKRADKVSISAEMQSPFLL